MERGGQGRTASGRRVVAVLTAGIVVVAGTVVAGAPGSGALALGAARSAAGNRSTGQYDRRQVPPNTSGKPACPKPGSRARPGAPATLGLSSLGATAPLWSATYGTPLAIQGSLAFVGSPCLAAISAPTGAVVWVDRNSSQLGWLAADRSVLLAARMVTLGRGNEFVAAWVDGLEALGPANGHPLWEVSFAPDEQQMPAVLAGGTVVVTLDNGTVEGLSETTGHRIWEDPRPAACRGTGGPGTPLAAPVGLGLPATKASGATAVVSYICQDTAGSSVSSIASIDARTGARAWTWRVPDEWQLQWQPTTSVASGGVGRAGVVAVVLGPAPSLDGTTPSGATGAAPARRTTLADRYDTGPSDIVVLDVANGRPLWELDDLPTPFAAVGGEGSVCALTEVGADCRSAADGAQRWARYWPSAGASAAFPALDSIAQAGAGEDDGAVVAGDRLYVALSTGAAPPDAGPPSGDIPALPVRFDVQGIDLATGRVLLRLPLPAYNGGDDSVEVSLNSPPAPLLVPGSTLLVSPQLDGSDVVEAFHLPA